MNIIAIPECNFESILISLVNIPSLSRRKRDIDEACLSINAGSIINQVLNK